MSIKIGHLCFEFVQIVLTEALIHAKLRLFFCKGLSLLLPLFFKHFDVQDLS